MVFSEDARIYAGVIKYANFSVDAGICNNLHYGKKYRYKL